MSAELIEAAFPSLAKSDYRITSHATGAYNCFAWGLANNTRWWSPVEEPGYHWPDSIPYNLKVDTFVRLYEENSGFQICDSHEVEHGFEKVAIYYCDIRQQVTHVARQLPNGKWTSKLGDWEDIEHNTLAAIEGRFYGKVVKVLKRKTP